MPHVDWSPADIEALATVDGRTREDALRIWRQHAPRGYADALESGGEPVDRDALDKWIAAVVLVMVGFSTQLRQREMDTATWQRTMAGLIVPAHVAGAAAAAGGLVRLTLADVALVEQKLVQGTSAEKGELVYLRELSEAIEGGLVATDGRFVRGRTPLYGRATRGTYHEVRAEIAGREGFDEERSILNPADHCGQCIEEALKGWRPIGSLVPIGGRTCVNNCKCDFWYRNSLTGEVKRV